MTQNPENARRCPMPNCGRVLKPEEKRCPICRPAKRLTEREPIKPRTEDWLCPDCLKTIPKEFQTCPICKKTHYFCKGCGTLLPIQDEVCPICPKKPGIIQKEMILSDEEAAVLKQKHEQEEKVDLEEEDIQEPGTSELDAEAEQDPIISGKTTVQDLIHEAEVKAKLESEQKPDGRKNNKLSPKKPDGRKQPWSEERKDEMRKLRQAGRVGKAPKKIRQTQTEAKKDALKKTQAAKKPDGRKNNGQKKPWSAKKQATKEPVEPEAPRGHPNDIETVILKSRYGEFIATDIASLQILKQIIAIVEHDLQPAKGAPR